MIFLCSSRVRDPAILGLRRWSVRSLPVGRTSFEQSRFNAELPQEAVAHKKEHFLEFVDSIIFTLPPDYRFNRDELYAR